MKMILKIARNELRNLFYSPVAWFLTLVFLIMCGVLFTKSVEPLTKMQDMAKENMPKFRDFGFSLTKKVFLQDGIFESILQNLYLFIPLLTMGLISREVNTGSVKLLYSSPVKIRQIVLGKYLAVMAYNMLLLFIVGIFIVTGLINIQQPDYGLLLSGCLGFYLLVCAYTSFGMFMSSLTNYQVVSALATFMVIFVLNHIGGLWQKYDFVRDLTYFLSLRGRTNMMLLGLITTKDVIYFLLIVSMFISFTILKLKFSRLALPWYRKTAAYAGIFIAVLTLGYLTSRPGYVGYLDATARNENTIHPKTQKILAAMNEGEIEVTLYTNMLEPGAGFTLPHARQYYVWNVWDMYVRFKPDINLKYVLYYDVKDGDSALYKRYAGKSLPQIAALTSDMIGYPLDRFLKPAEIRKMINLQDEDCHQVMQLKYKGRSVFLRTYPDPTFWPNQDHFIAAFKYLLEGDAPKMYFLTGHYERSIDKKGQRGYSNITTEKRFRNALVNFAFNIDTLSLDRQEVPADADVLVLADPRSALSDTVQTRIGKYLQQGGNMMLFGEPGKQEMMNPVLRPLGVQLGRGTVVEITKDETPDILLPYVTHAFTGIADDPGLLLQEEFLNRGLDTGIIRVPGAAPLEIADSGYAIKHMLVTKKQRNAWVKGGILVSDSATPVFNEREGDYRVDSVSTLIGLTRKAGAKEQRILVSGDADFLAKGNSWNQYIWGGLNAWLNNGRYPVFVPIRPSADVLFSIGHTTANVQHVIFVWILPAIILLAGIILLIRRKRK